MTSPGRPASNMQNEEDNPPSKDRHTAKGCCFTVLAVCLACFLLVLTAAAGIIIADSINLKGEEYTLPQRVERYKVAAQFIWADFKGWISGKISDDDPPPENGPSF